MDVNGVATFGLLETLIFVWYQHIDKRFFCFVTKHTSDRQTNRWQNVDGIARLDYCNALYADMSACREYTRTSDCENAQVWLYDVSTDRPTAPLAADTSTCKLLSCNTNL